MSARRPRPTKRRPDRHRVCVSLTEETHAALRELARTRECWKVEVVLDGLHRWDTPLREHASIQPERRRRRRRGANPMPYVMDLTGEELDRLDALAALVSPSRSALVRHLIELEASHDDVTAPAEETDRAS